MLKLWIASRAITMEINQYILYWPYFKLLSTIARNMPPSIFLGLLRFFNIDNISESTCVCKTFILCALQTYYIQRQTWKIMSSNVAIMFWVDFSNSSEDKLSTHTLNRYILGLLPNFEYFPRITVEWMFCVNLCPTFSLLLL